MAGEFQILIRNNNLRKAIIIKDGGKKDFDYLRSSGRNMYMLEMGMFRKYVPRFLRKPDGVLHFPSQKWSWRCRSLNKPLVINKFAGTTGNNFFRQH